MGSKSPGLVPYPPELVEVYRARGVWGGRTIWQEFAATAARHPDSIALVTPGARWSYSKLTSTADSIATGLLRSGLAPGDVVILQMTNCEHAVAAWYGILRAGLVPVCTLAIHRGHEIRQIAALTGAVAHLVQADAPKFDLVEFALGIRDERPEIAFLLTIGARPEQPGTRIEDLEAIVPSAMELERLDQIARDTDLESPAVLQLSGGTTGLPKVIPRLHEEYWYNARATAEWWGLGADDRLGFVLPLVHNAALANALFASHAVGATLVLGTPQADVILPLMAEEQVTWFMAAPGLMVDYQDHPAFAAAVSSLRTLVLTAARVDRPLFDQLEKKGLRVSQAFGMTEGIFLFTPVDADVELRAGSVGVPISQYDEVRLYLPGTEIEAGPGVPGELCARGPYTIRGYLNEPERNAQAFTADGFYRSGDIAALRNFDGEWSYCLEGRVKDLINRGGEKISAEEVESVLMQHPSIADVALVAMPDPRLGERSCAFIVLQATASSLELPDLCEFLESAGLAKFKWPERIEIIEVLPRTQIGKIAKALLREQVAGGLDSPRRLPVGVS